MNEDFDYLARKCFSFKKSLVAFDSQEYEDNWEFIQKYYDELDDCFNELILKYALCFPEAVVRKNEYYLLCLNEYNDIQKTINVIAGCPDEYE